MLLYHLYIPLLGCSFWLRSFSAGLQLKFPKTLLISKMTSVGSETFNASDEKKVVICGGGIIAASIAYHLTKKGIKPIIVERTSVAAAASGKASDNYSID